MMETVAALAFEIIRTAISVHDAYKNGSMTEQDALDALAVMKATLDPRDAAMDNKLADKFK